MDRVILDRAWRLADEAFRPCAAQADQGGVHGPIGGNLRKLGSEGFFGLCVSPEYGGLDADEATRHEYAEILASACGVTAFTQQQLQMGVKYVSESRNEALKRRILPELASGRLHCGIALSQLRRSGSPLMRAERVDRGYLLNGSIPWITGWSFLESFVLGATLEGGEHLFAYVEIERHRASLTAGEPLPLIVMAASDTVEVEVRDLFIEDASVLRREPATWQQHEEFRAITSHAALPLGSARASARYLQELAQQPGREALGQTAMALTFEINQCRREAFTWHCECVGHPEYATYALRARAGAIVLAMRAAHAAVVATGGRAHLMTSAPQRLLREAQFYATAVQTPEVQANTLDQIISPFFGL